jgi:hypothetical protein
MIQQGNKLLAGTRQQENKLQASTRQLGRLLGIRAVAQSLLGIRVAAKTLLEKLKERRTKWRTARSGEEEGTLRRILKELKLPTAIWSTLSR